MYRRSADSNKKRGSSIALCWLSLDLSSASPSSPVANKDRTAPAMGDRTCHRKGGRLRLSFSNVRSPIGGHIRDETGYLWTSTAPFTEPREGLRDLRSDGRRYGCPHIWGFRNERKIEASPSSRARPTPGDDRAPARRSRILRSVGRVVGARSSPRDHWPTTIGVNYVRVWEGV